MSLDQRAEALEQMIHAAFELAELPNTNRLKEIADELSEWLEQIITLFKSKY